ncbi:Aste57867_11791 [Aphanomyces stellatus]|uniref:Aste57867_11791 protein n=1 Tax=Aphanomyces stellatus TaxID=120398 RepID=A0A485KU60_9STRA|nr:hypothetical protein As57867_011746 [Aphanomyces stellatus]VFT88647.1 Aste57867_11791 [Aphanomyces stellatus]
MEANELSGYHNLVAPIFVQPHSVALAQVSLPLRNSPMYLPPWAMRQLLVLVALVVAMTHAADRYIGIIFADGTWMDAYYFPGRVVDFGSPKVIRKVELHNLDGEAPLTLYVFSGAQGSGNLSIATATQDDLAWHAQSYALAKPSAVTIFGAPNYMQPLTLPSQPVLAIPDTRDAAIGSVQVSAADGVLVALHSKPNFQGERSFLFQSVSDLVTTTTIVGSLQVLSLPSMLDLLQQDSAPDDAVEVWSYSTDPEHGSPVATKQLFRAADSIGVLPPGRAIAGFVIPPGLAVETFAQPGFVMQGPIWTSTHEGSYVQSFRVGRRRNHDPPRANVTLYSTENGSGAVLTVLPGEGVESTVFLGHLFPRNGFPAMLVPEGLVVVGYFDSGYRGDRTIFSAGFYGSYQTTGRKVESIDSLHVLRATDPLPPLHVDHVDDRVMCSVDAPNPYKAIYVGVSYPVLIPGYLKGLSKALKLVVLVFTRPWLLGPYRVWHLPDNSVWAGNEAEFANVQSIRVLWENDTLPPQPATLPPPRAPKVRGFPIFDLPPIELYAGEAIPSLIYPWDHHVLSFTIPHGLVVVVYSEPHFNLTNGRCASWTTDVVLDEMWNDSVRSLQVWNVTSNWTRCPTPPPTTDVPPRPPPTIPSHRPTPSPSTNSSDSHDGLDPPSDDGETHLPTNVPDTIFFPLATSTPSLSTGETDATPTHQPTTTSRPSVQPTTRTPSAKAKKFPTQVDAEPMDGAALPPLTMTPSVTTHRSIQQWALWAVVFCCVGIAIFIVAAIVTAIRAKPKADNTLTDDAEFPQEDYSALDWGELDMLKLHMPNLPLTQELATGAFGAIYLATFDHELVVVKTLRSTSPTRLEVQRFIDEIQAHGAIQSPSIVALIGAAWTHPSNLQAVIEYMNMGDLRSHLAATTPASFGWPAKVTCAYRVAEGLFCLHSQNMIHRDLKSRNILSDSTKGTKVADFGSSKEAVYGDTMTAAMGTLRWMAPEMLLFQGYSNAVDIFSLGVVLSELDTHAMPYANVVRDDNGRELSDEAIARRVIHEGLRPSFREDCPEWFKALALQCMAENPDERPSATKVMFILESQTTSTQR